MLIINPRSGRNRVRNGLMNIADIFSNNGYIPTIFTTGGKGDAEMYAEQNAGNFDLTVCRGGDGTFSEMLNGLMKLEHMPPVGYIPAGTTNELAVALGISTDVNAAAEIIVKNNLMNGDIGLFNNNRYFTYVASFGAFSECSYAASQSLKNKIGRLAYFYEGAKEIKDIRPIPMSVECDGNVFEDEFVIGSVSNSYSIGKVVKLDENEVSLNDGLFEVFLGKNPGSLKAWKDVLLSIRKRDFDQRYLRILKGKSVKFTVLDGKSIPWSLDGEFGGDNRDVEINVIHNAYRIFSKESVQQHNDKISERIREAVS